MKKFNKERYSIVTENGHQILIDDKGKEVAKQIWSRVNDSCESITTAIICVEVNLVSTREEAIKLYNENGDTTTP